MLCGFVRNLELITKFENLNLDQYQMYGPEIKERMETAIQRETLLNSTQNRITENMHVPHDSWIILPLVLGTLGTNDLETIYTLLI